MTTFCGTSTTITAGVVGYKRALNLLQCAKCVFNYSAFNTYPVANTAIFYKLPTLDDAFGYDFQVIIHKTEHLFWKYLNNNTVTSNIKYCNIN